MAKPVKGGYLLRHRKRLFGKAWREEWVVLYEDSTLAWYKEKGKGEPEGSVVVKEAPEMLAVSQWTLRIPGRPELPSGCQVVQLMAFGTRNGDKVHWLLAQSEEEVNGWMTAISNTLPPPPQPPDEKEGKINSERLDTVNPRLPPVSQHTSLPGEVPPALNNSAGPEYSQNSYVQGAGMTQPLFSNNTTNSSGGDLMTGLLLGAALSNWGHGLGWLSMPPAYTATTVNTVVNNHFDATHTAALTYDTYTSFDDGDYGMDCSGDFGF